MKLDTNTTRCLSLFSLILLLFLGTIPDALGQITITESEVQARIGQRLNVQSFEAEDPASLAGAVSATGENQTYDITSASFQQTFNGTIEYKALPADVPGADDPDFSGASFVQEIMFEGQGAAEDSTAWTFHEVRSDGLYNYGFVYVSSTDVNGDGSVPDTVKLAFDPALQSPALPVTFGTTWSTSAAQLISINGTPQPISVDISTEGEVDGYGTLITPAGEAACLRVAQTTETSTNFGTTTTQTIELLTEGEIEASIQMDGAGNIQGVSYTVLSVESGTPVEPEAELPEAFNLEQNYPNPFNPSTQIRYDLPAAQHVTLRVFDPLGRKVTTLVDGPQAAGSHRVQFDAGDLPSGVYLYRLQAEGVSQTRQMVLMK